MGHEGTRRRYSRKLYHEVNKIHDTMKKNGIIITTRRKLEKKKESLPPPSLRGETLEGMEGAS